jgi:DNA-binding transcriptional MerR regulator
VQTEKVTDTLTIGDFSRITHLSVKTLRHYQKVGLLEPVNVDPRTGYRHYTTDQIPNAQVIRRFRKLDMPVNTVKAVLAAPDTDARNELIVAHLDRMESELKDVQTAVASLRSLLEAPSATVFAAEHRKVPEITAAGIREIIPLDDLLPWFHGALGELYACVAAQGLPMTGPAGGLYSSDLFRYENGEATLFVPTNGELHPVGRIALLTIPAVELAVTVHEGAHTDIDVAYGELGTYVTQHELTVEGPVREYYLIDGHSTDDQSKWRTEVGWPIFLTGAKAKRP